MKEIPLSASVRCTDGPGGESAAVIVDPKTLQITHVVVKQQTGAKAQYLVHAARVQEVTPDSIQLDCTVKELTAMDRFVYTEYQEYEIPRYAGLDAAQLHYVPQTERVAVERERIPFGQLAVRPGAPVKATDGKVGELGELLSDAETGEITHVVLREGHVWGSRKVLLPLALVDSVIDGAIELTVDQQTIARLLAIPAKRLYSVVDVVFLVWTFDQAKVASQGLKALRGLAKGKAPAVLAAALLTKDAQGKTSLNEMGDVGKGHGALFGAIAGGLVGLMGGPVGAALGAAAGAATGRAAAKRIDLGFPDEFLKKLEEQVDPGTSSVIALVEQANVASVSEALADLEGETLQFPVTDEVFAKLAAGVATEEE